MPITTLHHVQLAMPPGQEDVARLFYRDLLGLPEIAKLEPLPSCEGVWFELGGVRVHLGVEQAFAPARKAHPAFLVDDLWALLIRLMAAGHRPNEMDHSAGYGRMYVSDPFGNRLEFLGRLE